MLLKVILLAAFLGYNYSNILKSIILQMNGTIESELEQPVDIPQYHSPPQRPKEVPEKIRKWKEEQEQMLFEKGI